MSAVKTSSSSSSSYSLSESLLHSSSFDSGFPGDIPSPFHIEEDAELSSLVEPYDDVEEVTVIAPSSQWHEPETVAILIPKVEAKVIRTLCSLSEVQEEVQQLEDHMSQNSIEAKEPFDNTSNTTTEEHSLYLDSITSPQAEATPRTAKVFPAFMPSDYLTLQISNEEEEFRVWPPDNQTKKRCIDDLYKGKEKDRSRLIEYSSESNAGDSDAQLPALIMQPEKSWTGGQSSHSFQDDIILDSADKTTSKRKIVMCRNPKTSKKPIDAGWQVQQSQWRKLVNLSIPQDPKRRSHWPPWLHPAFQIENDGVVPRISHADLQMLFQGVSHCPIKASSYIQLFRTILGPIACWNRDEEMVETIQAIGKSINDRFLMDLHHYIDLEIIFRPEMTVNYLFIVRYLGNFLSFHAFRKRDEEYRETLPDQLYHQLSDQMLNWYGAHGDVDDYVIWASARLSVLEDSNSHRPLRPKDLDAKELCEWQHGLDACSTMQEAITVTEEIFGPLEKMDHYECPKVDLKAVWSPCQCSICDRSRKKVKLE